MPRDKTLATSTGPEAAWQGPNTHRESSVFVNIAASNDLHLGRPTASVRIDPLDLLTFIAFSQDLYCKYAKGNCLNQLLYRSFVKFRDYESFIRIVLLLLEYNRYNVFHS